VANQTTIQGGYDLGRRRSQRVILSLGVTVRTEDAPKEAAFEEQTSTLVVNAHGALIVLTGKVKKGQNLRITNRASHAQEKCRVVYVGAASGGKAQIGIEFLNPSPDFWHIAFPPEDWVVPEASPLG
jgi:PilZ domain